MSKKQEERIVLRRGKAEHGWHTPSYLPPERQEGFRWRTTAQPSVVKETQPEESAVWGRRVRVAFVFLVTISAGLLAVQTSLKGFQAHGVSMEPTLNNGDRIIVNRLAYPQIDFGLLDWAPLFDISGHWSNPGRGDIIVFNSPEEGRELVKRVVGLPGEEVEIKGGRVYIDGAAFDEPYANGDTLCSGSCVWVVPDGHYFVLGDNREDSRDSREGWTVPIGNVDGKKLIAY